MLSRADCTGWPQRTAETESLPESATVLLKTSLHRITEKERRPANVQVVLEEIMKVSDPMTADTAAGNTSVVTVKALKGVMSMPEEDVRVVKVTARTESV